MLILSRLCLYDFSVWAYNGFVELKILALSRFARCGGPQEQSTATEQRSEVAEK